MARIAGVDLPRDKRTDIGLTYIYGIGRASALHILKKAGIDGAIRVKDLSEDKIVNFGKLSITTIKLRVTSERKSP